MRDIARLGFFIESAICCCIDFIRSVNYNDIITVSGDHHAYYTSTIRKSGETQHS